jgi:hypothetical protein
MFNENGLLASFDRAWRPLKGIWQLLYKWLFFLGWFLMGILGTGYELIQVG